MHQLGHALGLSPTVFEGVDSTTISGEASPSVLNYNGVPVCEEFLVIFETCTGPELLRLLRWDQLGVGPRRLGLSRREHPPPLLGDRRPAIRLWIARPLDDGRATRHGRYHTPNADGGLVAVAAVLFGEAGDEIELFSDRLRIVVVGR